MPPKSEDKGNYYVNKAEFSAAVQAYCITVRDAKDNNKPIPIVPRYIAKCFLDICEGLSMRPNFNRYTFREEMAGDAVENCLRAIENYNIDATTRSGKPNAFGYFTQIAWFAFIRRIVKEAKQQDIKMRYLQQSGIESMIADIDDPAAAQAIRAYIDTLRGNLDKTKIKDTIDTEHQVKPAKRGRKPKSETADSDLREFEE